MILDGRLHQIGRPDELTAHPADEFVASLTGGNLLHGVADGTHVTLDDGTVIEIAEPAHRPRRDRRLPVGDHRVSAAPGDGNVIAGTVGSITPDRGRTRVRIGPLVAEVAEPDGLARGAQAFASFAPGRRTRDRQELTWPAGPRRQRPSQAELDRMLARLREAAPEGDVAVALGLGRVEVSITVAAGDPVSAAAQARAPRRR